jgi:hypothetical protein
VILFGSGFGGKGMVVGSLAAAVWVSCELGVLIVNGVRQWREWLRGPASELPKGAGGSGSPRAVPPSGPPGSPLGWRGRARGRRWGRRAAGAGR